MALGKPVRKIAIVGTGVIGASWQPNSLHTVSTWSPPTPRLTLRKTCTSSSTRHGLLSALRAFQRMGCARD